MKEWRISRAYITRYSWRIEAKTEKEALQMLDDLENLHFEDADVDCDGPASEIRDIKDAAFFLGEK